MTVNLTRLLIMLLFSRRFLSPAMRCLLISCLIDGAGSVVLAQPIPATAAEASIDYNRNVRPLLAQYCFKCHGADEQAREGGFRLDESQSAWGEGDSGKQIIVPGISDQSELVRRIFSLDEQAVMPPPHTKTTMPDSAKQTIVDWIAQGAVYDKHWAYVAADAQEIERVLNQRYSDEATLHPIDFFVRQRLKQQGLSPSPPADKYTLVRRVYLDLIGLPPTPAEADAFVRDESSDAYEKLVDSLLQSPRYGERWARRWLDLARYADTNGFEKDRPRSIWPYRDWVIRALNDDLPYDQFSIKQLAGDMLPDASVDDIVATGFHRNTMLNEEGGIDPLEYRFYAMVDRVGVTGTTWLGLTLNCAQCHSHKYDPIEHADFYRLMALLNNADEPVYHLSSTEENHELETRRKNLENLTTSLAEHFPGGRQALESALNGWIQSQLPHCSSWQVIRPSRISTSLPHLEIQEDGFLLGSGDITKSDFYELELQAEISDVSALRIEVTSHPSLPGGGPGLTYYEGPIGGFFLSELQAQQFGQSIAFSSAEASNEDEDDQINDASAKLKKKAAAKSKTAKKNNAAAALDGEMSSGWQVLGGWGVQHAAVFHFAQPISLHDGLQLKMFFEKHFACPMGYFRVSVTTDKQATATGHPAQIESLLSRPSKDWTKLERQAVEQYYLEHCSELAELTEPLWEARRRPPGSTQTLVMRERPTKNPRQTYRYHRGEFLQPREQVQPGTPSILPPLPADQPANRLTFARWLFSPDHPLTARVAANRHWQAFFGRGIVKTLEDFGYQADAPTHPELLDWLALQLIENGWSMKKLHRQIVTSETYRQSSRVTASAIDRDPQNIWLSRASRFRLDAEIIRDGALHAAGILSPKMGGPGVFPPQPANVTTEGTYGGMQWTASEGEDRFRRSIYTFMKRTAPFAMAATFDAPSGESCLARRDVSNSPLQALTLLNDQMFIETAQALATSIIEQTQTDRQRVASIFRRCLTRPATEEELDQADQFIGQLKQTISDQANVWSLFCRAVMNLDEVITHP